MKKKYIELPKGYLSYSQIQSWRGNPKRYKEVYFDGRTEFSIYNEGMEYGKQFADALETYTDTNDLLTDASILLLAKYDVRDQEIRAELKTKDGCIPLLGRPDTMNSKTFAFREYKTGKQPWTQNKANKHFQLYFYAMLIYLKYGVVVEKCHLDWIETEVVNNKTQPTGKTLSFPVKIGLRKILETMSETIVVAKEIELAYASHITRPEDKF